MTQRLLLDVREVRDRVRLRLLAALPALAGGIWLLWTTDNTLLRLLAGAGLVFATVWVVRARSSVAQLASAGDHYLETDPEGLTVRAGAQQRRLAWSEIAAVEIDEDRLVIQLRLQSGGRPLAIEPQYGELGLYELGEWIQRARPDQMAGVRSPQS
jgi:hypothetical protein